MEIKHKLDYNKKDKYLSLCGIKKGINCTTINEDVNCEKCLKLLKLKQQ